MKYLNETQRRNFLEVMRAYLSAPGESEKTAVQEDQELNANRNEIIEKELKSLIASFFNNKIPLLDFKFKIDSINKRHNFWGFSGIKGQMFFNLLVKMVDQLDKREKEIKKAITIPEDEESAAKKIRRFSGYVNDVSKIFVDSGGSKFKKPMISSIPFFLSYFWQIQDNLTWPIYYPNDVKAMESLNLFEQTGNLAEDYIKFLHIYKDLVKLYSNEIKMNSGNYNVERVFWYKEMSSNYNEDDSQRNDVQSGWKNETNDNKGELIKLPTSFVPPIVAVLPKIAKNDVQLKKAAKESGVMLQQLFEKYTNSAFTILSYETELLGQGKGRVPDGRAIDTDNRYAIIWDTKVRQDGYSMGTDDRTIREYISTQSRELKKRYSLRNIYYIIISSKFKNDHEESINNLKMETNVNEVILMEADALVEIVDIKLRDPVQIPLGPDGIQRLFTKSGILTKKRVHEVLLLS